MDPGSVDADVVTAIEEKHRALIPTFVRHPDVRQLNGRLADRTDTSIERWVHAWWVAVEQDKDGRLNADLWQQTRQFKVAT